MAIDFELSEGSKLAQAHYHDIALKQMRPISRKYDLQEHALPVEWVDYWWKEGRFAGKARSDKLTEGFVTICLQAEELCSKAAALRPL